MKPNRSSFNRSLGAACTEKPATPAQPSRLAGPLSGAGAPATPQHSPLPWQKKNGFMLLVLTEEGAQRLDHIVVHADKLADALRNVLDAPRNEQNAIALLGRVESALADYDKETAQ